MDRSLIMTHFVFIYLLFFFYIFLHIFMLHFLIHYNFCFILMPLSLNYVCFTGFDLFIHLFELLLLDLASIFFSIPPSPSFLMNDSDVSLPEASGKMCEPRLSDSDINRNLFEDLDAFINSFCFAWYVDMFDFCLSLWRSGYIVVLGMRGFSVRLLLHTVSTCFKLQW